jgi:hypothetical protein
MSTVEEKIETVKSRFVGGNLFAILWILVGTAACFVVSPLFGWLFLGFSAFSVYIIVRRLLCNSCYYCKSCTKGLAKLSILFLGASKIPGLSKGTIWGMNVFTYVILMIIPCAVIISSLFSEFATLKLALLGLLLGFSVFDVANKIRNRNRALWKPTASK